MAAIRNRWLLNGLFGFAGISAHENKGLLISAEIDDLMQSMVK